MSITNLLRRNHLSIFFISLFLFQGTLLASDVEKCAQIQEKLRAAFSDDISSLVSSIDRNKGVETLKNLDILNMLVFPDGPCGAEELKINLILKYVICKKANKVLDLLTWKPPIFGKGYPAYRDAYKIMQEQEGKMFVNLTTVLWNMSRQFDFSVDNN